MSQSKPLDFIGLLFKVEIADKRVLDGILTVVDPFGNLLLSNTWETSRDKLNDKNLHKREIGLVSVPREAILKIYVSKSSIRV